MYQEFQPAKPRFENTDFYSKITPSRDYIHIINYIDNPPGTLPRSREKLPGRNTEYLKKQVV